LRTWRYVDPRTETSLWWALQSIESGATVVDAAVGGTGGCPFAPQAARKVGNIATEDLVYLLHGMGYETGVDIEDLMEIAAWMEEQLEKELPGQVYKAGVFEPVT
jgi:(R)-citramalyl-CoA lyase